MPNPIKYTAGTETLALKKGNFYIGTGDVGKGPSDTTGYYQGPSPTSGGYVIYLNKEGAPGGLSYHSAANDAQLIAFTNNLAGQSYTTVQECLVYFAGQSDKVVLNRDYEGIVTDGLVLNLDGGFTPSYPRSGTTWSDLSLSSNNGTLTNGPTYNTDGGGSIVFDGVNDYVDCGNTSITNITSPNLTLAAIFTSTNINTTQTIMSKAEAGGYGLELNVTEPSLQVSIHIGGSYRIVNYASSNLQSNSIYYVVGTYDNNQIKLYVNGIQVNALTMSGSITSTSVPMCLGTNPASGGGGIRYLNGKIYTTQIYNRALSATEVLQNYNAQKGRFGL
jgi:hypothetical protein